MVDSAVKVNLRLFDEILVNLSDTSLHALERGDCFLPIYKALADTRPYLKNFVLYCNEHFGSQIAFSANNESDIFLAAQSDRQAIALLHQTIQKQNFEISSDFNLYTETGIMALGSLLRQIDNLPSDEQSIQKYFMQGMLTSAVAITSYARQSKRDSIFNQVNNSDIPEKLIDTLYSCGVSVTDENEDILYDILYQECDDNLAKRNSPSTQSLTKSLAAHIHKQFSIDVDQISPLLHPAGDSLCRLIRRTKQKMRRYQSATRELLLFSQNLPLPDHHSAETLIYGGNLLKQPLQQTPLFAKGKAVPPYLLPFAQMPQFKEIQKQASYWQAYEKPLPEKVSLDIKSLLCVLSLSSIKSLYQDFEYYDEILNSLVEKYSEDDDEVLISNTFDTEQEDELLNFAEEFLVILDIANKYAGINLNETGVSVDTIKNMHAKSSLDEKDVDLLFELFASIENNIEDAAEIINLAVMPDYEESARLIQKLPHGVVKKEALSCFLTSLECTWSDICEEMECILFDIDNVAGHPAPAIDDVIVDFLQSGMSEYQDLNHYSAEELAQKLHKGVLSVYILPKLQGTPFDGNENEEAMLFIDDYDNLSPATQQYLQGLAQYYGTKVTAFQPKRKSRSKKMLKQINDYYSCFFYLSDISQLQEQIEASLADEENLFKNYQQYKEQKSFYEIPSSVDLWLSAQMAKNKCASL